MTNNGDPLEFVLECGVGDVYREITRLPQAYELWPEELFDFYGPNIVNDLLARGLIITSTSGKVLINVSRLNEILEKGETQ